MPPTDLTAIRARHQPISGDIPGQQWCVTDDEPWPCDTAQVLAALEGLEPERLARLFHENYERLAPDFGYTTRRESAVPWEEVPTKNRTLMVAAVRAALADTGSAGDE